MNKPHYFLGLVFAVLVLGGAGCSPMNQNNGIPAFIDEGANTVEVDTDTSTESLVELEAKAGSYLSYDPIFLGRAKTGKVVLFFKAGWCHTCQDVDVDITARLNEIPVGTTILKVDYDGAAELRKKYGVTYQHTFVQVDESGAMIKKWSGSPTLADLSAEIQ